MYQDPEVAQIIRRLDEKKHEAVHQERYDYAKKLKQAIADLQKVLLKDCSSLKPRGTPVIHQGLLALMWNCNAFQYVVKTVILNSDDSI